MGFGVVKFFFFLKRMLYGDLWIMVLGEDWCCCDVEIYLGSYRIFIFIYFFKNYVFFKIIGMVEEFKIFLYE